MVFILWGSHAQSKLPLIDTSRHHVICSPHPSPLSASRGFFGSRPFSRTNAFLRSVGMEEIDWTIPDIPDYPSYRPHGPGTPAARPAGRA